MQRQLGCACPGNWGVFSFTKIILFIPIFYYSSTFNYLSTFTKHTYLHELYRFFYVVQCFFFLQSNTLLRDVLPKCNLLSENKVGFAAVVVAKILSGFASSQGRRYVSWRRAHERDCTLPFTFLFPFLLKNRAVKTLAKCMDWTESPE